jgi:predicted Zn-dependent protease
LRLPAVALRAVIVVVCALGLGFVRYGDLGALLQSHPVPRKLQSPEVDRVILVVFPDVPASIGDSIWNDLAARYDISGSVVVRAAPLDPSSWNPVRHQFGAERATDSMLRTSPVFEPGRTVVVGLTTADLYIESMTWNWAFAVRRNGAALVSMARMHRRFELDGARSLMRKMVLRELGFLAWGLPATDDPGDLMYRDVLDLHDLVAMSDDL